AASSHDVIPIDRCPVLDPGLNGALDAAWALAEPLTRMGKPLDIQATSAIITTLSRIAQTHPLARLTRHGELVLMRNAPDVTIGTAQVTLPPGSFLQATTAGEEALAALVEKHAGRARHIADLFCGVGPFALRLARRARVSAF